MGAAQADLQRDQQPGRCQDEHDSDAAKRYVYRITTVLRHATDRSAATDVPADERLLILQTSEGPSGTVPKLQVVAEFVSVASVEPRDTIPTASPTACYIGT